MSNIFLKQFHIVPLVQLPGWFGQNVGFTNSALCMILATLLTILVMTLSVRKRALVPGKLQVFGELIFEFIDKMVSEVVGPGSAPMVPLIIAIFVFIASCNLLGLLPGSFTVTSHVAVTFFMSASLLVLITVCGIKKQGWGFFSIFLPHGVPFWLAPIMVPVEFIAYIFKSVSLSLRLSANMVAGHIMLKVIAVLGSQMSSVLLMAVPTIFLSALIAFEFFVALLQAYIFTVLSCVYLSDAFKKH